MSFFHREQMDCCNFAEVTDKEIIVNSGSNWMQLESIQGETKQNKTTGAQLLNSSELVIGGLGGNNGIEFDSLTRIRTGFLPVTENKFYTLSGYTPYVMQNSFVYDADKVKIDNWYTDSVIPQNGAYVRVSIRKTDEGEFTESDLEVLKNTIMFNVGTTALPWEPYTGGLPSPSPSYPQEIVNANINSVTVKSTNLFEINKMKIESNGNVQYSINVAEGTISIDNESIITSKEFRIMYELSHEDMVKLFVPGNVNINLNTDQTKFNPYFIIQFLGDGLETISYTFANRNKFSFILNESILNNKLYKIKFLLFASINTEIIKCKIQPMIYQKGDGKYEPYHSPQNIALSLSEPLRKVGNIYDEITSKGKNLLNPDTLVKGMVNANTGILNPNATSFVSSDFIYVNPGNYIASGENINSYLNYAVFFDKDKKILESNKSASFDKTTAIVNVPIGAVFMRIRFISKDGSSGEISVEEVKNLNPMINEGNIAFPYEPYSFIPSMRRINRCIELTFNGSEKWSVYENIGRDFEGFLLANALPERMSRRNGFCNQLTIDSTGDRLEKNVLWLGVNGSIIYAIYNQFFDSTLPDKGLANWKAHLNANPLKIVTYLSPENYTETPLEQSNIDAIKSLYAYKGATIVSNNENTTMEIMYKNK